MFHKKGKKESPPISTASLPDIVFMLLFFFMVSTKIRNATVLVAQKLPVASEVTKLEKKSAISYIYVGPPNKNDLIARYGTAARIQLNDAFRTVDDIAKFVINEKEKLSEAEQKKMLMFIKSDETTHMGIITNIKQELRKMNALHISYSARESSKKNK